MTNINIGNLEYVNKTLFWEAFGVLLVAFWMTLGPSGDFWGVSGGLLGTPGGLGEPLGGTFGIKC